MKKYILIILIIGIASYYFVYKKNYFEFDEIEHYKIEISIPDATGLYENPEKSGIKFFKKDIIVGNIPKSITDTLFINNLENAGFKKNKISEDKFDEINNIFSKKIHFIREGYACDPIFWDILIFKRKSKIIGIAKICFGCKQSQIVGTDLDTEYFVQGGDFDDLENVLSKKN